MSENTHPETLRLRLSGIQNAKANGPPSPPSMERPGKLGNASFQNASESYGFLADLQSLDRIFENAANSTTSQTPAKATLDDTTLLAPKIMLHDTNNRRAGPLDDTVICNQDVALKNSQMEVKRLQRALEEEMERADKQRAKLESEIREYRKLARLSAAAAVRTPPSSRKASMSTMANMDHHLPVHGYVIGLTGNSACGKHTVGAIMRDLGASVIDADALAIELQRKGQDTYNAIVDLFGRGLLDEKGEIKRDELSRLVYSDSKKKRTFEHMMHKAIGEESLRRMRSARSHVIVYLARKLLEASHMKFNAVWVVTCDRETQIQRLQKRGMTEAEAAARVDSEPSQKMHMERATAVLRSSSASVESLRSSIVRLWSVIPQPSSSNDSRVLARLLALDGTDPTVELLAEADVLFGRSEKCHVQVADVTVSHIQCRIWCGEDERFWLDDLSTHGTYVNGKKVGHGLRVPLIPGDSIHLSKMAVKGKTMAHTYVFQREDLLATRVVQFPSRRRVPPVQRDRWVERTSESHPGMIYWVNTRTGATTINPPDL